MTIQLSNRVQSIKPSATLASAVKARALRSQGISLIDFGVGEPDFDTPKSIKQAGIAAIDRGFTKYTPVDGILDLRKAIAQKFLKNNQLHYDPNQILVSNGCKQSIYNMAQAYLNPGDEVIIFAPYWVSYPHMMMLAGAKPVVVSAGIEQQFKITPEQLKQAITSKTRLILFNSPSNPTGIAYTREEFRALGKVLLDHPEILIATDDIYEHILWGKEPFCNILMANPELYDRTIILHGVSKTYAMTGWRIGFAAGPTSLIQAMCTIQGQSTSGPCSISQVAALAALEGDQDCVQQMVMAFKERHDYILPALNALPGFQCLAANGAFYLFPKVEPVIKRFSLNNDQELSDFFLNQAHVVTVPGSGFGASGYLRFSFANSLENLHEGIRRLKTVLE